jgi:hypothetical protein
MKIDKNSNALVPTSVSKTCDNYDSIMTPDLSQDTTTNSHVLLSLNVNVKFDEDASCAYIKPTSRTLVYNQYTNSVSSVSSNVNSVMKEIKQNLTMSNDNTLHATLSLRDRFKLKIFKVHDVKRHGNDTLLLKISTEDLHARGSYATQSIQLTEDSDLMDFKPALIRLVNERLRSLLQEQMQQQMQQFRNSFPAINGATPLTDDDLPISYQANGWWRAGQSGDQPFGGRVWIRARGEIPPTRLYSLRSPGTWNEVTRTLRIWLRNFDERTNSEAWRLNQIIIPVNLNDRVVNGIRTNIEFVNCRGNACLVQNGQGCGDPPCNLNQRPCWINEIRRWENGNTRDTGLNNSLVGPRGELRPGCCSFRDGIFPPNYPGCSREFFPSDSQCSGGRCRW